MPIVFRLLAALMVLLPFPAAGQSARVVFYNTENFYDTVPSPTGQDADFTPRGKYRWDGERYQLKTEGIARTLAFSGGGQFPAVMGLAEVESEFVIQGLTDSPFLAGGGYSFVCSAQAGRTDRCVAFVYGRDFVLSHWQRVECGAGLRPLLHVCGELHGTRMHFVVCHLPSQFNRNRMRTEAARAIGSLIDSVRTTEPDARIVVMGDMNMTPSDKIMKRLAAGAGFNNPFGDLSRRGAGTLVYNNRWLLYDQILYGGALSVAECGIVRPGFLLRADGAPLRTYAGGEYLGGCSDHLPVYITFSFLK